MGRRIPREQETVMGTTLSTLSPPKGARHRRKRIGRGPGSGWGTTAGKGQKGQKSRSGKKIGAWFEGGQMPLQRRLPKRGFKNPFRVEYVPVNLDDLARVFAEGETVDPDTLRDRGMVPRRAGRIKILGRGELDFPLEVKAHAFSDSARKKVEAAGGSVEVIPPRGGDAGKKNEASKQG